MTVSACCLHSQLVVMQCQFAWLNKSISEYLSLINFTLWLTLWPQKLNIHLHSAGKLDGREVNENYLYKWVSVKVVDFARTVAEILVKLLDDVWGENHASKTSDDVSCKLVVKKWTIMQTFAVIVI